MWYRMFRRRALNYTAPLPSTLPLKKAGTVPTALSKDSEIQEHLYALVIGLGIVALFVIVLDFATIVLMQMDGLH